VSDFAARLVGGFLVSLVLTPIVKGAVALSGHSIAWLWAAVIALFLTFGGVLILDSDWID
jgi:hypothetical protein